MIMRIVVDFPTPGLGRSWQIPWQAERSGQERVMESIDVDYDRISVDRANTGHSTESQHGENVEFSAENGRVISATYCDNDKSAFSGVERPEFQRLLRDMAAGRIRSVTVWHANRLLRSTDEANAYVRLARKHNVLLYSKSRGAAYNLELASGRKALRDDTSEAEYESEHRGERVALARKRQARNGDYGGGVRSYGWGVDSGRVRSVCVNPKAPAMERVYEDHPVLDMTRHNEDEVAEIRRWASDLLSGVTMAQILRNLAARGVPTPAMTDGRTLRRNGRIVEHKGWNSKTIYQVLTSPRTSGHSVYRGQIVKRNAFKPILEDDIREALISLFADPARKMAPGNTPRWLGSLIYRCGACDDGTTMTVRKNSHGVNVYRCRDNGNCSWPAQMVDKYVENVIVALLSRDDVADLLPRDNDVDVTALREEMKALHERKIAAARKFALLEDDEPVLDAIKAAADARIAEIRAELAAATDESPFADFVTSDDAQKTWDDMSLGRKREILRRLLTVTLPPIGRGHRASRNLIGITRTSRRTKAA
jgi:site-specific DNA recombinase